MLQNEEKNLNIQDKVKHYIREVLLSHLIKSTIIIVFEKNVFLYMLSNVVRIKQKNCTPTFGL